MAGRDHRRGRAASQRGARPRVEALESRRLLTVNITELPIPYAGGDPLDITTGPDGNLWFTLGINKIGTIDATTHAVSEYTTPTPRSQPHQIVAGPDGQIWFTEVGVGKIGAIDPATKQIAEYSLPTPFAQPEGITVGPDGKIWFTEVGQVTTLSSGTSQVGSIDPTTHAITEYATPTARSFPTGITAGTDGALWFTEGGAEQIGRVDPTTGTVAEFPVPSGGPNTGSASRIATGKDGRLWFTEPGPLSRVGVMDPTTHAVTQISVPRAYALTVTADGNIWLTEPSAIAGQIGEIDPTTLAVTQHPAPQTAPQAAPAGITVGPDGKLWVAMQSATATETPGVPTGIGTLDPTTDATAFYPYTTGLLPEPDAVVAGPDGRIWFTNDSGPTTTGEVGALDPATGTFTEFPFTLAPSGSNAWSYAIAVGPDGALWFTVAVLSGKEEINRLDPATGHVTTFDVGDYGGLQTSQNVPVGITAGPDGNIWFAMSGSQIGEIDLATQAVSFYSVPNPDPVHSLPSPNQITVGPDGNLWFTDLDHFAGNKIGTMNVTTHVITEFPLPDQTAEPEAIVAGPDGNLWFTEKAADKVATIDPATHQITEYAVSTPAAYPNGIALGSDGKLWFTEDTGNQIGSIDPMTHQITEFPTPTADMYGNLAGITTGPDGKLYFAEKALGAIGVADLSAGLAPAPSLTAASDTGTSQTDGITSNNGSAAAPLVFTIPSAGGGLDYRLYDVTDPNNPVLLAGPVTTSDDTVTVSDHALADGVHRIAYTWTAVGGDTTTGESSLSAPLTVTVQTSLTITGTDPADGAVVGFLPDGSVTITFSHPLAGLTPGGSALLPNDPHDVMLIPRGPDGVFSAPSGLDAGDLPMPVHTLYRVNPNGTATITITPTTPVTADVFLVAVSLGDFQDAAGNPLTDSGDGYRTFLLQPRYFEHQPPRVVGVTADNGTVTIDNNVIAQPDTISIHVNTPLFAGAAGGGNVQLIANPGPHFSVVPAVAAYSPTTDSIELTPEAKLNPGTVYVVAVSGVVSNDQGYGGPGYPIGQTFYDSFTVASTPDTPVIDPNGLFGVAGAPDSPQITPFPGTNSTNPLGYVSAKLTWSLDMTSLGRYSVMLIPRSGGTDGSQFDAADVPVSATVAFNPNTNQLIIVPSQPMASDVYLLALGAMKDTLGDPLLNNAGQPAGVGGNAPYYATFQVSNQVASAVSLGAHAAVASAPVVVAAPAASTSRNATVRPSTAVAVPAGPLRARPAQGAVAVSRPRTWG